MQAGLLDDPALLAGAATDVGLDPDELSTWCASDAARAELEADAAAARNPVPAARALDHKLGGPRAQRWYTTPTYLIAGDCVPGFTPIEAYEAVIANRAPGLARRPKPGSAAEVLDWASEPLATAEAALIMQVDIDEAREELQAVGTFQPAGADGYWTR